MTADAMQSAAPLLLESLHRPEYRGYGGAGFATLVNGHIERRRCGGKLGKLEAVLRAAPLCGSTDIGHTRCATHGATTAGNAHPHATSRVAVVHNGIIENQAGLRAELEASGQTLTSDTDTGIIVQVARYSPPARPVAGRSNRGSFAPARRQLRTGHDLRGISGADDRRAALRAARRWFRHGEMFLASDALAMAPLTQRIAYLHDGDWAVICRNDVRFADRSAPILYAIPVQLLAYEVAVLRGTDVDQAAIWRNR